jgi:hypothetical protein
MQRSGADLLFPAGKEVTTPSTLAPTFLAQVINVRFMPDQRLRGLALLPVVTGECC